MKRRANGKLPEINRSSGNGSRALAVFAGRNAGRKPEDLGKVALIAESGRFGDLLHLPATNSSLVVAATADLIANLLSLLLIFS